MKIEVQGLDRLIKGLETVGSAQKVNAIVNKTLEQAALKIQAEAKINCPKDTSYLEQRITKEKIPNGYAVGTNVKYGVYVEFGTGLRGDPSVPHTKRAVWKYRHPRYTKLAGKDVIRTVHGMAPRPFLLPAFNRYKDKIPAAIKINLSKALKEAIRHG